MHSLCSEPFTDRKHLIPSNHFPKSKALGRERAAQLCNIHFSFFTLMPKTKEQFCIFQDLGSSALKGQKIDIVSLPLFYCALGSTSSQYYWYKMFLSIYKFVCIIFIIVGALGRTWYAHACIVNTYACAVYFLMVLSMFSTWLLFQLRYADYWCRINLCK